MSALPMVASIVKLGQTLDVERVRNMSIADGIELQRLLRLAHGVKKHVRKECDACVRGDECTGKRTGVVPA